MRAGLSSAHPLQSYHYTEHRMTAQAGPSRPSYTGTLSGFHELFIPRLKSNSPPCHPLLVRFRELDGRVCKWRVGLFSKQLAAYGLNTKGAIPATNCDSIMPEKPEIWINWYEIEMFGCHQGHVEDILGPVSWKESDNCSKPEDLSTYVIFLLFSSS